MSPLSYLLQRGTAFILAPLVIIHFIVIIIAVQGGLTGEEILARTRGNAAWGAFYGLFVLAAAVHAGIGVQAILREWTPLGRFGSTMAGRTLMVVLLVLGARAVYAVVWA